ncbi:MAG: FAD-dependent thymidylate synthase [Lachnospiraceae bacterium]|nr:FAD-dependent thymidylate synthase [Lachnospiraceae bacterium]
MGTITIQDLTTKNPITLMGMESGICYNSNTSDPEKNYKRGLECVKTNHGRVLEYPQVYMVIDGYSAKVIRELYTHIGGAPTRLQASTRYIDYEHGFEYVTPAKVKANPEALDVYNSTIDVIKNALLKLDTLGIPREDSSMVLPLCMTTKVVLRTNLRNLSDMSRQRMCTRAWWEFRQLFNDIVTALSSYSEEWKTLTTDASLNLFSPKCEVLGYCPEKNSCGRKPKKEQ